MKQKGQILVWIIIGVLIIAGIAGGGYYLGRINGAKLSSNSSNTSNITEISTNKEFQLSSSEVIRKINGQNSVLFKNVEGVSEIRLGPDGKSLHFKPIGKPKRGQQYCANLEEKDKPAPSSYPSPPPNQPPWDFKTITHAYTISWCGGNNVNGYLINSNYFAYLQLVNPEKGYVIYEDLISGKKNQVQIDTNLLYGLNDTNTKRANSYWIRGIIGKDSYTYYYPHQDIKINDKLFLAFGRLIAAINTSDNYLVGGKGFSLYTDQDFGIVIDSFHFINEKSLPFVIIESVWEGPSIFSALIDIANDQFKIVKLANLDKRSLVDFGIEPVVWEDNSILFNFLDFEDITKQLPKDYINIDFITKLSNIEIEQLNRKAEEILSTGGKYKSIKCNLGPGIGGGICDGLKEVIHYRYSSSQGLVKI